MTRFDYFMMNCSPEEILDQYDTGTFTEFIYKMGGDVMRVRVYGNCADNYMIVEK